MTKQEIISRRWERRQKRRRRRTTRQLMRMQIQVDCRNAREKIAEWFADIGYRISHSSFFEVTGDILTLFVSLVGAAAIVALVAFMVVLIVFAFKSW